MWWMVERNRPQALDALVSARKSKAGKDDADKIYAAVESDLTKRQSARPSLTSTYVYRPPSFFRGISSIFTDHRMVV